MFKNITDVKGIKCWGAHIGIKSKRRDLALIYSTVPAAAAAVFTRNLVAAEPIKLSRLHIKDGRLQAIVINSGNANACTGKQGWEGALAMAETTAEGLGIDKKLVLVASTGVIGRTFPTRKVVDGIKENIDKLSDRQVAGSLAANAILTTDTFAKEGYVSFEIDGKQVNLAGIAKGSGMIHPDMGTMLCVICCDLAISPRLLQQALTKVVDQTFNMISVDGDTSTNDMVAIMCNGEAGNKQITRKNTEYKDFEDNLHKLCSHLARLIVSDGEGSSKFIEYHVTGAPSDEAARQIVRTIADSCLVKTAMFGCDPNWGRIIAAAGRAGVDFKPDKMSLYLGDRRKIKILQDGQPVSQSRSKLRKEMESTHIKIALDLNQGEGEAIGWGADLSYEYVRINAEYET